MKYVIGLIFASFILGCEVPDGTINGTITQSPKDSSEEEEEVSEESDDTSDTTPDMSQEETPTQAQLCVEKVVTNIVEVTVENAYTTVTVNGCTLVQENFYVKSISHLVMVFDNFECQGEHIALLHPGDVFWPNPEANYMLVPTGEGSQIKILTLTEEEL